MLFIEAVHSILLVLLPYGALHSTEETRMFLVTSTDVMVLQQRWAVLDSACLQLTGSYSSLVLIMITYLEWHLAGVLSI